MDQNQTPLIDAISAFEARHVSYFNIPAHRGACGAGERARSLLGDAAFRADLTETDGTDDLHAATGPILEAERLAADLFGSDECRFLVNGTTCGNEAMILASVRDGEKILIPRSAHKSAWMGLVLSGASPVWMNPPLIVSPGGNAISGPIPPEEIEEALKADPEIRAVFLTSPTYYGICSSVRDIADVCHKRDCVLLVDEAHGTHLYFHEAFPGGAVSSGADLVAQSMHKTGGSFTQSSLLHRCGTRISPDRLSDCLKLVQSTSPSYLLMASLDGARHELAVRGREKMDRALHLAREAEERLSAIGGVRVMRSGGAQGTVSERSGAIVRDPLRLVFSAGELGIGGIELQQRLFRRNVTTEMADPGNIVAVITDGNTMCDILRLAEGVRECTKDGSPSGSSDPAGFRLSGARMDLPPLPEMAMSPREAFSAETETVFLDQAAGKIAGEMIAPYPPGIPAICPGERITEEMIRYLRNLKQNGISFHGPADRTISRIRVVS